MPRQHVLSSDCGIMNFRKFFQNVAIFGRILYIVPVLNDEISGHNGNQDPSFIVLKQSSYNCILLTVLLK
jgi:hypothetical protein